MAQRSPESDSMSDTFMNMNHVWAKLAHEPREAQHRSNVPLVTQRQRKESDACSNTSLLERPIGPADHVRPVAALSETRRSLEHLMNRSRVELVLFENLKNGQR